MGHNCHFSDCWPPTSNGHNFFVRTPFQVFLDSMEIPLSQDSSHAPVEDSGVVITLLKSMFCTKCAGCLVVSM